MATRKGEEIMIVGHPLSSFEGVSDEEILGIKGIGPKTLEEIRAAQAKVIELTAAEVGDAAEAAEEAERKLGEAESKPKTCRGCKDELPEGWEYPYCTKCHEVWQRQQEAQAKSRSKGELERVTGILKGIFERNPWYDYTEVKEAFAKVGEAYRRGEYQGVVRQLWQEVLPLANKITVVGVTGYVEGLLMELPRQDFPKLRAVLDEAEHLFGQGNFKDAVDKAYEARRLAGELGLRARAEEAKDDEFIDTLVSELESPRDRRQRPKKG